MYWARALAFDNTGKSNAASIAMMAMTTSSSINVNASFVLLTPILPRLIESMTMEDGSRLPQKNKQRPGRDAFHRVTNFFSRRAGEFRDAVERVPTRAWGEE